MVIASRKKCRYKIGTLDINKTNEDNMVVLNKCRLFYSEFGYTDGSQFDFSFFSGVSPFLDDVSFLMMGKTISLSRAGKVDVHVDYYDRSITFYGIQDNLKLTLNIKKAAVIGINIMDVFKLVCNWYLPLREISTVIYTRDEFDEINPLSGRIKSINTVAKSTTNDTAVNCIEVDRKFDEESNMVNCGITIRTNEPFNDRGGWNILSGDEVEKNLILFNDDNFTYSLRQQRDDDIHTVQIK